LFTDRKSFVGRLDVSFGAWCDEDYDGSLTAQVMFAEGAVLNYHIENFLEREVQEVATALFANVDHVQATDEVFGVLFKLIAEHPKFKHHFQKTVLEASFATIEGVVDSKPRL